MKQYDVFISYSRKDSVIADVLCECLDRCRITYFIDKECISGGKDFAKEITDAMLVSRIFLFIASKNSYESMYSINEVQFFREKFKDKKDRMIIPYLIDGAVMPKELDFILGTINKLNINEHPIDSYLIQNILMTLNTTMSNDCISINNGRSGVLPQSIRPQNLTLSYFSGEQYSDNYEQIVKIGKQLGYSVKIYTSNNATQFDFLQAVYRDTVIIVDATIPNDLSLSTIFPILTAHVNILDHILVFSDKLYKDGSQMLPINIEPQRKRTVADKDLLVWLIVQLKDLKEHQYYERFEIESLEKLADYKLMMENVMSVSLGMHKNVASDKKRVMISYRNSCSNDVELFRRREEAKGEVEITMLPPGSLCDDYEAHTPMRRWMLVGLLEDYIRGVEEVWVYYNNIYPNSWWTLAEMVMVAYINYDRANEDKVKVLVYDAGKKRFINKGEKEYPDFLHVQLSKSQYKRLARYLSNTRPNTMGPEALQQIDGLKWMARVMRFMSKKKRTLFVEQMRPIIEQSVPSDLPKEECDMMVNELLSMYSNPKSIMTYANDAVFKNEFWNNISYQTKSITGAFKDNTIDVDIFIDTPMQELTKFTDENLHIATDVNAQIKLKGKKYYVSEGKKRYLWLATRMGMPMVKDAPGLEIVQTYNLLTHDQIVSLVMKMLL